MCTIETVLNKKKINTQLWQTCYKHSRCACMSGQDVWSQTETSGCIYFSKHLDQNFVKTDRTERKGRQILERWQEKEEFHKTNHHRNPEEGTTAKPGVYFCLVYVHGQVQVHISRLPSPV